MEINFPNDLEQFRRVKNMNHLKQLITSSAEADNTLVKYRINLRKQIYLYGQCCQCKAHFRYRLNQDSQQFQLVSVQPYHYHVFKHARYQPLRTFLQTLPSLTTRKEARSIVRQHFRISNSQFYYAYRCAFEQKKTVNQFLKEIDQQGYDVHIQPNPLGANGKPSMMLIITPEMKKYYQKFGHYVSLDFTFNLFKEVSSQGVSYKAGYLMGYSFSRRMVPFGIVLAINESRHTYYSILRAFIETMGSEPNFIVTDQAQGAVSALIQLKNQNIFQGQHLLDVHHILRNLQSKLQDKDAVIQFSKLIRAESLVKYHHQADRIYEIVRQQQVQIVDKFLQTAHKYCMSQMVGNFIGILPSTGGNERSHEYLKTIIPQSKSLVVVLNKMLSLTSYLHSKCYHYQVQSVPIEKFFGYPQIKLIRLSLDKKIFCLFSQQLSLSLKTEMIRTEQEVMILDYQDQFRYRLTPSQYFDEVIQQCQCNFQLRWGIPCRHQLRFAIVSRQRLINYVNPFWRCSTYDFEPVTSRVSTGRKTRRHK